MKICLPENVNIIIGKLKENGYEAYAVGGCIRDSILGRVPDDWDITTNAEPKQIKALFDRTVDTGIEHGTVTVLKGNEAYEVTTYRIDGKYSDGRHPDSVSFTKNLEEDLKRRDFTINAMAYNEEDGFVDLFEGREDLKKGVIRAVGNATERMTEDALRILRAVRFAAQLDYEIDDELKEAIKTLAGRLEMISAERINVELTKLLTSPHPEKMEMLYDLGVTKIILPEFDDIMNTTQNNPHHCYDVGRHTIKALQEIRADKVLRFTMLFHDLGKAKTKTTDEEGIDHFHGHAEISEKMAHTILRRLKSDNDTLKRVCLLVKYHDLRFPAEKKNVRRAVSKVGKENFLPLTEVMRADILAQSDYKREEKLAHLDRVISLYEDIVRDEECLSLKELAVDGKELMSWGVEAGPGLGVILNDMLNYVLEDPDKNNKDDLKEFFDRNRR